MRRASARVGGEEPQGSHAGRAELEQLIAAGGEGRPRRGLRRANHGRAERLPSALRRAVTGEGESSAGPPWPAPQAFNPSSSGVLRRQERTSAPLYPMPSLKCDPDQSGVQGVGDLGG